MRLAKLSVLTMVEWVGPRVPDTYPREVTGEVGSSSLRPD
jgi:hypothetical protein